MAIIGWVIIGVLTIYGWILIFRAILSWIPTLIPGWKPRKLGLVFAETIYTLTDPILKPLRKFIKPLRLGSISLDIAFLLVFFLVILGIRVAQSVFF